MAPISIPWGYTTLPIPAALISIVISIFLITYNKLSTNLQLNSSDLSISCQGDTKKNLRICFSIHGSVTLLFPIHLGQSSRYYPSILEISGPFFKVYSLT